MVTAGTPNTTSSKTTKSREAGFGEAAVEIALEPVVGCVTPIIGENLPITCRRDVELVTLQHDALQTEDHRAVGVSGPIRIRVVSAVDSNPFPGHRARAEPQPESEEVPQHRVQHETAMGLVAVKVQGDPEEHQLYRRDSECDIAPPWQANCTVKEMSEHHPTSRGRIPGSRC